MKALVKILTLLTALSSLTAGAQQSHQFNDYTVHYNALNSSLISPGVAKTYNIRRSDSRALVNIAVLKDIENQLPVAVKALVTVSARNLTGQNRQVKMREIIEGGARLKFAPMMVPLRNQSLANSKVVHIPRHTLQSAKWSSGASPATA